MTTATASVRFEAAGFFLDALTRRDFTALASCLAPEARFRALIPPGAFELTGATETAARFRQWFGDHDEFEVLDAAIGQVGARFYLRWRFRAARAGAAAQIVEQHAFGTTTDEWIDSLDLLCSGFQAERSG